MKRIKPQPNDALVQTRVPRGVALRLRVEADAQGLTVAGWLRRFLMLAIGRVEDNPLETLLTKETRK